MPSGCKDIGIRKFEFVVKTQFLWPVKGEKMNGLEELMVGVGEKKKRS